MSLEVFPTATTKLFSICSSRGSMHSSILFRKVPGKDKTPKTNLKKFKSWEMSLQAVNKTSYAITTMYRLIIALVPNQAMQPSVLSKIPCDFLRRTSISWLQIDSNLPRKPKNIGLTIMGDSSENVIHSLAMILIKWINPKYSNRWKISRRNYKKVVIRHNLNSSLSVGKILKAKVTLAVDRAWPWKSRIIFHTSVARHFNSLTNW